MVKEFLSQHNVEFEQYNVAENEEARETMIDKYDSMSTPTIIIGDQVITGFDPDKLTRLLNLA
ncbi:glutaredoxin family protein [Pseudalkalibacillus berkeleyi]|uniref:Glutaredoxin family protein n=1 Tax=Pseudalkalibacillus berkeleyi TaxID=1069813 RepID=A0ABS9H0Z1_9BACL|nr:glutaredoxin family protein [Pseudalkalibacillus berkeleyi]MCF6137320.1 glutaredoxin family protein [Pseudalkalibacillus berkeleyi]